MGIVGKAGGEQEGAYYIELNGLVADKYDAMGQAAVKVIFSGR